MPRDYGAVLSRIGEGFCDAGHEQELERFFRPRVQAFAGGDRNFAQALEQVRQCAAFREKAAAALTQWLRS
jgi:hypothetical protein